MPRSSEPRICRACGAVRPHEARGYCRACYNAAYQAGTLPPPLPRRGTPLGGRATLLPRPPVVRCTCGRPAHPVTGTCLCCGDGWPELDTPDGRAKDSDATYAAWAKPVKQRDTAPAVRAWAAAVGLPRE